MRAAVVLALGSLLLAGPSLAECVTPPISHISVMAGAGKDQRIWSLHTGGGWSHTIVSMPGWMRAKRAARHGYDVVDLWGIPRSGTYEVSARYTNSKKSIVCQFNLRFK